jgi:type 1 glutamine amidotransferase
MLSRLLLAALAVAFAAPAGAADPPKKVLLVGSPPDDHAPGTHEYMAGVDILAKLLKPVPGVEVTVARAQGPWKDGPELVGRSDCVVLFLTEGAKWLSDDAGRLAAFRAMAKRGGGLACLHWGMGTREAGPVAAFVELFGGCHGGPDRKYAVVDVETEIADKRHPVLTGVEPVRVEDEFYYRLKFASDRVVPLLRVPIEGQSHVVAWGWERPDKGRSFGFSGAHFHRNWEKPAYRRMVAQGILWTLGISPPEGGLEVSVQPEDLRLER